MVLLVTQQRTAMYRRTTKNSWNETAREVSRGVYHHVNNRTLQVPLHQGFITLHARCVAGDSARAYENMYHIRCIIYIFIRYIAALYISGVATGHFRRIEIVQARFISMSTTLERIQQVRYAMSVFTRSPSRLKSTLSNVNISYRVGSKDTTRVVSVADLTLTP